MEQEYKERDESASIHVELKNDTHSIVNTKMNMKSVCPICLGDIYSFDGDDDIEQSSSTKKIELESCGHIFCKECLSQYCISKIETGNVNIKCCHPVDESSKKFRSCGVPFSEREIHLLVRNSHKVQQIDGSKNKVDYIAKYERFKFDIEHEDCSRRCPSCDHPHIFEMNSTSVCKEKRKNNNPTKTTFTSLFFLNLERPSSTWDIIKKREVIDPTRPASEDIEMNSVNFSKLSKATTISSSTINMQIQGSVKYINQVDNDLVIEQPEEKKPKNPVVSCMKCSTEFCYYHSNAHPGEICEEYIIRSENENILSFNYIDNFTKECPVCHARVEKSGGCNQIKCANCNTNFCWICLAIVDDSNFPAHFQWWNVNGCPNMQLNEGPKPSKFLLYFTKFIALVLVILIGIPALLLTFATYAFCGMCHCICPSPRSGETIWDRALQYISFWGNCFICVAISPILFCSCVLSGFIWLVTSFLACVGCGSQGGVLNGGL